MNTIDISNHLNDTIDINPTRCCYVKRHPIFSSICEHAVFPTRRQRGNHRFSQQAPSFFRARLVCSCIGADVARTESGQGRSKASPGIGVERRDRRYCSFFGGDGFPRYRRLLPEHSPVVLIQPFSRCHWATPFPHQDQSVRLGLVRLCKSNRHALTTQNEP